MRTAFPIHGLVTGLLVAIVTAELYATRHHFLDDAFIHLRIAHNLLDYGRFVYNPGSVNSGSSSPLYAALLAGISLASRSPFVPKAVNLVAYIALLLVIWRTWWSASGLKQDLLLIALVAAASPFGVRWLSDGMETGIVALAAIGLAASAAALEKPDIAPPLHARVVVALLSAAAVLLRIEFLFVVMLAVAAVVCARLLVDSFRQACWRGLPLALGALIGMLVHVVALGHLVPDTAIAKQHSEAPVDLLGTLQTTLRLHASASLFGLGLLFLWTTSLIAAWRGARQRPRIVLAVTNAGMPLFVILLAVSRQSLQGLRYFVFLEVFLIALNMAHVTRERPPRPPWLLPCTAVAAVVWFTADAALFARVVRGRSLTFEQFTSMNLTRLAGKYGVAYDIGMVGYFTGGLMLDVNGLIDGRDTARLTCTTRLQQFARFPVDFVFANQQQLKQVAQYIDVSHMSPAAEFAFPNVNGTPDVHILLIRGR